VTEARLGYPSAYFNADDRLYAVCKRHAVKWYVSRALQHRAIPDLSEFPDLVAAFDHTEALMPTSSRSSSRATPADLPNPVDRPSAGRARPPAHAKPKPAAKPGPTHFVLSARPSDGLRTPANRPARVRIEEPV
jgi:hypothetical protein